jgi:hypothetical protein
VCAAFGGVCADSRSPASPTSSSSLTSAPATKALRAPVMTRPSMLFLLCQVLQHGVQLIQGALVQGVHRRRVDHQQRGEAAGRDLVGFEAQVAVASGRSGAPGRAGRRSASRDDSLDRVDDLRDCAASTDRRAACRAGSRAACGACICRSAFPGRRAPRGSPTARRWRPSRCAPGPAGGKIVIAEARPVAGIRNATGVSPFSSCGAPTTTTLPTGESLRRVLSRRIAPSISSVPMRWPETLITSSERPCRV